MSYINKISYQIYKVEKKPYRQMLDELFSHLDVKSILSLRRFFVCWSVS